MYEIMRIICLSVAMILVAVSAYNFPIAKSMSSTVAVTGKQIVTPAEKSHIQIGGKYAETVKSQSPNLYVIEFQLDSYNMTIDVDKENFDSIRVGRHIQISYNKGGLFSQYELLSAKLIE